jgi:hypothetical protein
MMVQMNEDAASDKPAHGTEATMDQLVDRILNLEPDLVPEACKNLRLGLVHEARKQGGDAGPDPIDTLRGLELEGDAERLRTILLDEAERDDAIQIGRLALIMAARDERLRPYVSGALDGAEMGVRVVDPVSILAIGTAIYMVGRLLPKIDISRETVDADGQVERTRIKIKPLADPLAGLASLLQSIPALGGRRAAP